MLEIINCIQYIEAPIVSIEGGRKDTFINNVILDFRIFDSFLDYFGLLLIELAMVPNINDTKSIIKIVFHWK